MVTASKPLQIPQARQPLRIPSTATSSRYQAGMRTPRRKRASGIACRSLIRSRSVAAEAVSGTGRRRYHRPNPLLAAQARAPVTHFESALPPAPTSPAKGHENRRLTGSFSPHSPHLSHCDKLSRGFIPGPTKAVAALVHQASRCRVGKICPETKPMGAAQLFLSSYPDKRDSPPRCA